MLTLTMPLPNDLILGSQSPRRREILSFFGLPFRVIRPDVDEESVPFSGDPAAYAIEVARRKALHLKAQYPSSTILTADTVVHRQGQLFMKPGTAEEAHAMLRALAGVEHQVFTGVVVAGPSGLKGEAEETRVHFCELTDGEIAKYAAAFHPFDKAGGYAIQQAGALIVKRIEGCYYNVMGLPLQTTRRLLKQVAGLDLWDFFRSALV